MTGADLRQDADVNNLVALRLPRLRKLTLLSAPASALFTTLLHSALLAARIVTLTLDHGVPGVHSLLLCTPKT